ncbi:TonB-dependent receptor [Marivirga arenosa]|uniref:TonB-dependent receptor n=1 Tax=Marivirga arenosa TaxID=3059076 RepID=A0AA52EZN1_9BACT|nr:TonB-dependent receptor [Marivirga sp. BKB1-2]WNB18442.1 TonB-dependent receptor [Marivirga sp. BKB1-2]
MLRLLIITFLFFSHFFVLAQKFEGNVVGTDGQPLEAVLLTFHPMKVRTTTDIEGKFAINIDKQQKVESIEINHVTHIPQIIPISEFKNLNDIKIVCHEDVQTLFEVKVVSDNILSRVIDKTQPVQMVDKDFIERNSSGTFSGALAALPGVNTINVGVGIAKPMIRGMSFNRIMVNNRGIKQEGQQWGADHGLEIDPFDVDQVEVIKGPGSLLFGPDGMGGVINIKENNIPLQDGNTIEYLSSYQTNNHAFSNSLEFKGKKRALFYSARMTHQDFGDYSVPADDFTYAGFELPIEENRLKNTAGNELHLSALIGLKYQNFKSSLRFTSFNQEAGIFTGAIGLPRSYNLRHNGDFRNVDLPKQRNQHHMLISNSYWRFGNQKFELDLGYQRNNRNELSFPGAHGIAPEYANSNLALGLHLNTYTANLRYEFNPNPNHQILMGGQFQWMENQRDGFEFLLPDYTSSQLGFYHYQLFDMKDQFILNGGIRYDRASHQINQHLQPVFDRGTLQPTGEMMERTPAFDRYFENFSGGLGVTYMATKQDHIKFNLGNSFRYPTAIELSSNGVHHGNFRHELGDRDLDIENGYQADINYIHQSEQLFLEISAFYAYYNDYIYLAPTGNFSFLASGGTMWQYRQDDALFNGFEISTSYQPVFYFKNETVIEFVQNLNLNSRLALPLTPPPSIVNTFEFENFVSEGYRLKEEYLFISGRYNFAQNRTDRNERPTFDSFILNFGAGAHTLFFNQEFDFKFSVNNALNTFYFNHISRYRLINLPEQGRNFTFSVKITI